MMSFSKRLLPVLQLTRMALVFTAIADGLCELLLRTRASVGADQSILPHLDGRLVVAMAAVSAGLYGYGMSLNDIIDRRRDRQLASHRPLPSGNIGLITAHVICALMGAVALVAGAFYARGVGAIDGLAGWPCFALLIFVGLLITFYDIAGKYLVAVGLLSLGLIRGFQAAIAAPQLPLPWHPLLLMNHIVILSTFAYAWEEKRPTLTRLHWSVVGTALAVIDAVVIVSACCWWPGAGMLHAKAALLWPVVAGGVFIGLAVWIRRTTPAEKGAGQKLMLYGLLWLIVYDALFVAGYVGWLSGALLLVLLPVAWLSVRIMRWWSAMVELSQRPRFQRAGREDQDKTPND